MKDDIIAAMKDCTEASDANKKFGDAILKNICDNIVVTYSWRGTDPATAASDPVTEFEGVVSGGGTLTPSDSFAAMLPKLSALIKGLIIMPPAGFALTPLLFNPAGALSITMNKEDNQSDAMTTFCSQLVDSVISNFVNPAPSSGANGNFIGATTSMEIE